MFSMQSYKIKLHFLQLDRLTSRLQPRAQMIATYALCGFSNFGSVSIQLGILGTMVPEKKSVLARIALRALMAGSISCFYTACLAGESWWQFRFFSSA
jgi:nucleoside permease NupC